MPKLIKQDECIDNSWVTLDKGVSPNENTQTALIHVSSYQASLETAGKPMGIWLDSSDNLASLPSDLGSLAVIAINFPVFMDGRGFSLARQIREQRDYRGELRAIGNFMADQVFYLKRCGFDCFEVADDVDLQTHLKLITAFRDTYQAAADEPRPLFRRRG